jgi:hypothetical protein
LLLESSIQFRRLVLLLDLKEDRERLLTWFSIQKNKTHVHYACQSVPQKNKNPELVKGKQN